MKSKYDIKPISEGCTVFSGFAFESKDFTNLGIPVIKIANIQNGKVRADNSQCFPPDKINSKIKNYFLKNKDVLIAMTGQGSVGRVGHLIIKEKEKVLLNQRVGKFVTDEKNLHQEYLYFILSSKRYEKILFDKAIGSGQPNLSPGDILETEIPFPSFEEQKAIASILSSLDDKTDLNNKMNHTLEQIPQAIFKHWFIDFEFPNEEGEPYKSSGGEMVDSELGEIPKGWAIESLSNLGDIICGKTPSKKIKENFGGEIPFIKIPDMHGNIFIINTEDSLSEIGVETQSNKEIPANSICVSCIATVGLVSLTSQPSHTNQQINSIIPLHDFYTYYLYFQFKSIKDYLINLASGGSATLNLNTGQFSKIKVIIPQKSLLVKYHNLVTPIFEKILLNMNENKSLADLRNNLLPKLISGKIRVKTDE